MLEVHPLITQLTNIRLARRLSQREVAEKAGMCTATIYLSERGRRSPRLDFLVRWAHALDVNVTGMPEGGSHENACLACAHPGRRQRL